MLDLAGDSAVVTHTKLWDGDEEPRHKTVPANYKMMGSGSVEIKESMFAGSIQFEGMVSIAMYEWSCMLVS